MESKAEQRRAAEAQLRELERLQRTETALVPSRGLAMLEVIVAVVLCAYVWLVFAASHAGSGAGPVEDSYTPTMLLVVPILMTSGLVQGARNKFGVRSTPTRSQWVAYGVLFAAYCVLGVLSLSSVGYPSWLNVAVVVGLFLAFGARPLRRLLTSSGDVREGWESAHLSPQARTTTALIGVALAAQVSMSIAPLAAAIAGIVVLLVLVAMLLAWRSRYGLTAVGSEWGLIQWSVFLFCVAIAFASSVLVATGNTSSPLMIAAGIVVLLAMAAVALLPRKRVQ